jgi:hypothetical protein
MQEPSISLCGAPYYLSLTQCSLASAKVCLLIAGDFWGGSPIAAAQITLVPMVGGA